MKNVIKILAVAYLMILSDNCFATMQKGVYMTASDYRNRKMSYENSDKILIHHSAWDLNYITIVNHGKKVKFRKDQIFGYADNTDKVYRFYNSQEYLIAEAGPVYVYSQNEYIQQYKARTKVKTVYFFSESYDSEIRLLTVKNLKIAFAENEKFEDLIDQFLGCGDVASYDTIHNTYKVNYVYNKALK